ncbi:ABC transporter ATP-binding protein [Paenibacillus koleovorans]|uniref:ABC transporter ATP-binding protein n=1 Tax=Paenibacillus koleovorans TaxID=121608 RepID=UPI000FD6DBCA|nr:ABC transporter ATP-binding protein [Paenibacillus koleovorans]
MNNVWWFARAIGMVRWGVTVGLLLFAIKIVASLVMTGIQKWIIDDIFIQGMYGRAVWYLSIFAAALLVYNAFHAIAARFIDASAFRLFRLLTETLVTRLHKWPTAAIQGDRTAKFVHYVNGDVQAVTSMIQGFLPQGLQHGISLLLLGGLIGWASPLLLVSILAVSAVYMIVGRYFGPRVKAAAKNVQEQKSNLLVQIEEGISSSREVIAYHRLKWEDERFSGLFAKYFKSVMDEGRLENKQTLASDPLRWIITFLTLGIGGTLVIQRSISLGTFVVVYQFASGLMDAAQGLFQFAMQVSGRMAAVERLRKLLGTDSWKDGDRRLGGPITSIELDHVRFRYADTLPLVLDGVDGKLPVGRKIAFVGTSGGGKSTVAQLLVRFFDPVEGQIAVNRISLTDIERQEWADKVQIVFQEPYLFPDTIRTNLTLGRTVTPDQLEQACRIAQIDTFIEQLPERFETEVGERGVTLSGGQRQRLALARALLGNPEILILDEATSALDLETERRIQQAIDKEREGRTTIVIAHRLSTIRNADIIYVMQDGKIAETGTHDELTARNGVYVSLSERERQEAFVG